MKYPENAIIKIQAEKNLQNKPSKGRNQWCFIKKFDGKTVKEFIAKSEQLTRADPAQFQTGSWWNRELEWNIERNNIVLRYSF